MILISLSRDSENWADDKKRISVGKVFAMLYSPLVKNISQQENISFNKLDNLPGTGKNDCLTKQDLINYLRYRKSEAFEVTTSPTSISTSPHLEQFDLTQII